MGRYVFDPAIVSLSVAGGPEYRADADGVFDLPDDSDFLTSLTQCGLRFVTAPAAAPASGAGEETPPAAAEAAAPAEPPAAPKRRGRPPKVVISPEESAIDIAEA